ncbi:double-strand break repair helicase AddA [Aureimonas endophytica]|uniref:DNA 3'-5' helicase n=1 Tax=Aureimonas endophytica TaxID=2027858 RepID=A0A917A102_9HYPH|nr:double-strand break repair helicase AddA [Aureimonas endophytica]GGE21624.1 double-strand break repair helicase AddA [Aureimonas endophytica]
MSALTVSDATREAQLGASDPTSSVIVAANAGSGKTHVLTERVVRLLLSGAEPAKILCLTYTKAAAAEMSTRVFDRLSRWTTAPQEALDTELKRLFGRAVSPDERRRARRLFAEALETPGGLKIQTIHAFCEAILHQFPLEANVAGHFEVMDDKESRLLLGEARRRLVTGDGHPPAERAALAESFAEVLSFGGEWGLDGLIGEIVAKRDALRRHVEEAGGLEAAVARLAASLGLKGDETEDGLLAAGLDPVAGFDAPFRQSLAAVAATSTKATDKALLAHLEAVETAPGPRARLEALREIAFTQKGEPRKPGGVATKAVAEFHEDFAERLAALARQIGKLDEALASLKLFRASRAALVIADRLEEDYAVLKRRRGRLDFEDLVVRTADLLSRSEAAAWVHYKLDQGIDHVLIDEAQDTSPRQWQVMNALVDEFFVGASARGAPRTVFAVGDEKQSIYSFQGASPLRFAEERRRLRQRAEAAGMPFSERRLHQSFRSAATILQAVDHVFADPANRGGLSSEGLAPVHETARGTDPGLVEVWPAVSASVVTEPEDWRQPIDAEPESSPSNRLARRIALQIKAWLGTPVRDRNGWHPMTPGDVLVLVRKRSAFVGAMAKALRAKDIAIPVAGADRLVLTDHIAVQDLMALGHAVANIEDELSLAACLKSPLFGFAEAELMALALSRDGKDEHIGLYAALRNLAGRKGASLVPDCLPQAARGAFLARAREAYTRLEELRARAGFAGVFSFYSRVLGPEEGRALLTGRLGSDAGEVIDAFLDLALAAEEDGRSGLDAFLADLCAAPPEIKREMEHGRSEVRIMTVHASKGLEAPVVFLVDPGSAPFSHAHGARLMRWTDMPGLAPGQAPGFLWRADKALENGAVRALRDEEKRLAGEEYRRLLYVGMTRAADRLVVCGTAGIRGPHEESWLSRVQAALAPEAEELTDAEGEVVGWRLGALPTFTTETQKPAEAKRPRRAIDLRPLPAEPLAPRPLSPSTAGGAHRLEMADDELAADDEGPATASPVLGGPAGPSLAIRTGIAMHRLLQVLPDLAEAEREAGAEAYLERTLGELPAEERSRLLRTALKVLADPAFAAAFAPGSRAEVSLSGTLELGDASYAVSGTIDRIAATGDEVLIVDYKTSRPVPERADEIPAPFVLQLALYRRLVQPIYPGRTVRAAVLFTEAPRLVELSPAAMEEALRRRALRSRSETGRSQGDALA